MGPDLRESFLQVQAALASARMVLNPKKTAVVPQLAFTTRDSGVDVQWGPWRNPVQQGRVGTFQRATRLAVFQKAFTIKPLPMALYGAQMSGMADRHLQSSRVAVQAALGSGASWRPSWSSLSVAAWWLIPRSPWTRRCCVRGPVRVEGSGPASRRSGEMPFVSPCDSRFPS